MIINGEVFTEAAPAAGARSPSETYATDGSSCERVFEFGPATYADRHRKVKALVGFSVVETDAPAEPPRVWIRRQPPHGYPAPRDADVNPTGSPYVYAVGPVTGEPAGAPTGVDSEGRSAYQRFRLRVKYQALSYQALDDAAVWARNPPLGAGGGGGLIGGIPDEGEALAASWRYTRYVSKYVNDSYRTITLPNGMFKFADRKNPTVAGTLAPANFPFISTEAQVKYTWHNVPQDGVPYGAIGTCLGAVNHAAFDGHFKGTLLFRSYTLKPEVGPFGQRQFQVEYTFSYKPNKSPVDSEACGHNSFLRVVAKKLDYWFLSDDGLMAGRMPYDYQDFAALFRPDQVWPPPPR
jgi:hypothetical protein